MLMLRLGQGRWQEALLQLCGQLCRASGELPCLRRRWAPECRGDLAGQAIPVRHLSQEMQVIRGCPGGLGIRCYQEFLWRVHLPCTSFQLEQLAVCVRSMTGQRACLRRQTRTSRRAVHAW